MRRRIPGLFGRLPGRCARKRHNRSWARWAGIRYVNRLAGSRARGACGRFALPRPSGGVRGSPPKNKKSPGKKIRAYLHPALCNEARACLRPGFLDAPGSEGHSQSRPSQAPVVRRPLRHSAGATAGRGAGVLSPPLARSARPGRAQAPMRAGQRYRLAVRICSTVPVSRLNASRSAPASARRARASDCHASRSARASS